MRSLIDSKQIELNELKAFHLKQLDTYKVIYKDAGYREAEHVYQEKETRAFQKFDEERVELFKQLRKAEKLNQNFDEAIRREQLKRGVSLKFSILTVFNRWWDGAFLHIWIS